MKTAISLSDQLFQEAEELAARLGVSRSELYARALEEFVRARRKQVVTEELDRVYQSHPSPLDPDVLAAQSRLLSDESW